MTLHPEYEINPTRIAEKIIEKDFELIFGEEPEEVETRELEEV